MVNRFFFTVLFLTIAFSFQSIFAQEQSAKINFGILDENGDFVSGAKASDFKILQNKKFIEIKSLKEINDKPLELAILIDASASQEKMIPLEKQIAESLINNVLKQGKDKVVIVKFSDEPVLVQNLTENFSEAKTRLNAIEFEPPAGYIGGGLMIGTPSSKSVTAGSTSIWDSVKSVIEGFSKIKKSDSRRILILISDGVNTSGENKLKEAIAVSTENQVPIFAIGIGDENYDGIDKNSLKKITGQTGGILILPNKKMTDLPEKIKALKNSFHSIYEAEISADFNDLQEIKIEIINQDLLKRKVRIAQPKY